MAVESKREKIIRQGTIYPIVTAGAVVMLFPLLWTLSTSLKTIDQVTTLQIDLIPNPIAWWNYIELFHVAPVLRYLRNTMIVVTASVFGGVIVCSFIGYGFARIQFPGRELLFLILLSTMMLPGVVQLVPLFVIFDRLGWTGTFLPLIVPRLLGHNPFYIFLLRQFFRGVPMELSDAARIDGCSEFGIWWRIVMPVSKPVLAAVAIFSFQYAWNDFLPPLVYLGSNQELWTLALGLNAFRSFEGQQTSTHFLMAMSVLMTIPMLIVFAIGQREFVRGVVMSGIRG